MWWSGLSVALSPRDFCCSLRWCCKLESIIRITMWMLENLRWFIRCWRKCITAADGNRCKQQPNDLSRFGTQWLTEPSERLHVFWYLPDTSLLPSLVMYSSAACSVMCQQNVSQCLTECRECFYDVLGLLCFLTIETWVKEVKGKMDSIKYQEILLGKHHAY